MHAQRTGWGREAPGRESDYDHDSSTGSRIRACFWQNYTTGSQTTTGGNIQSVPAVTWEPPPPPPTTPDRPGRSVPPSSPTRKKSSLHGLINGTVGLVVLIIIIAAGAGCGTTSTHGASVAPTTTPTTKAPTSPPSTRVQPGPATTPATRPPVTTVPLPATTPPASPATSTALAGLATLPVKGRAPLTGYSRAQFGPAWTDDVSVAGGHNGCDTRNDILRRDLTNVVIKPGTHGCTVASGVLHDPYTNTVIAFTRGESTSAAVQIDHVVALGDAWQTGAQQLSLPVRTNMANDPLELLAVSGAANEQKGDADAASWLPANKAFRCPYVAIQVAVKIRYHLWVTPAEHAAIARVLSSCPSQPVPSGGPPATTSPATVARPAGPVPSAAPPRTATPVPTTAAPAAPPGLPVVHPGAFCTPHGARGVTSAGTLMTCKLDSTGQRYRWSRA